MSNESSNTKKGVVMQEQKTKLRVIDIKTMRSYFGEQALEIIHTQREQNSLLIDKFLGIDKLGKEIYERDILEDKQKQTFMIGAFFGGKDIPQRHLKTYKVIGNAHKERLETLF